MERQEVRHGHLVVRSDALHIMTQKEYEQELIHAFNAGEESVEERSALGSRYKYYVKDYFISRFIRDRSG